MNKILYENRCKCNEDFLITKKRKPNKRSEGKPLPYLKSNEITYKTFQLKYDKNLSLTTKFILNSFKNKYLYYAIDEILYLFKSNPIEKNNLLEILFSLIVSLQNNFSIDFFDIWIHEIYINDIRNFNKFLMNDSQKLKNFSYITIKLLYKNKLPIKKNQSLW